MILRTVLDQAAKGLFVFATWPHADGRCACGLDKRRCPGPGKHPRFAKGQWTQERWSSTSDPSVIEKIWAAHPDSGYGIDTGASGLLVLDLDSEDAMNWLAVQEGRRGEIVTYQVNTGRGMHVYLRAPEVAVKSTVGALHKGVDTRAYGGMVIGPGNTHKTGRKYEVDNDVPIAPCPTWLVEMLRAAGCLRETRKGLVVPTGPVTPGQCDSAKGICDHYCKRIEGTEFPGPIHTLLNESAFRLGQFVAAGALDRDYVVSRLADALCFRDPRQVYFDKNLRIIELALIDAEDQPDIPHTPAGSSITREDLKALARPASVAGMVKASLRAAVEGNELSEPEYAQEAINRTAHHLASKKPDTSLTSIDNLFAQSLSLMDRVAKQRGLPPIPPDAVSKAFAHVLEKEQEKADAEPWRMQIVTSKDGAPKDTVGNIVLIFRSHKDVSGLFGYSLRSGKTVYLREPPWGGKVNAEIKDTDYGSMAAWLTEYLQFSPRTAHIAEAVKNIASGAASDPVREYLDGLEWDGVPRIDKWLCTYAGAEDSSFVRSAGKCWLISGVARTYRPGCKADYVLILEGKQGVKKSTLLKELAVGFFTDELHDLGGKGAAEIIHGPWIVEICEIDRILGSRDSGLLKSFIARPVDRYRAAYAREPEDRPRTCVFAATTNEAQYLVDATGDRRYWPITITACDVDAVIRDRDQLWAEAVACYKAGEPWWLDETIDATSEQDMRTATDPWEERMEDLEVSLKERSGSLTTADALDLCGVPQAQHSRALARRVGHTLRRLGWEYKASWKDGRTVKRWCKIFIG